MRMTIAAVLILLAGGTAYAAVGGGDLTMKNEGGDVIFSHEAHVKAASLGCQECHPKIFLNTKNHVAVTMEQMEAGKSCGSCHDGTTAFSVKGDCEKCHSQESAKEGGRQ